MARHRLRRLDRELARKYPQLDAGELLASGAVRVDGRVATNPRALVRSEAAIVVAADAPLRGELKLTAALDAFEINVDGCVALDVGAAAGGFTKVLLGRGAARVYAVDAGFGQLLGSLRQDARVVNLERVNLGALSRALVPEPVDVVTLDLSYLAVARAAPQLSRIDVRKDAALVALVKPMFELGVSRPPTDAPALLEAVERASVGVRAAGWEVSATTESPVRGARGAIEFFVHARRSRHTFDTVT